MAKKKQPVRKTTTKKRTLNSATIQSGGGAPFSEQDPQRRLGNFEGTGEAPRKGGRTSGIVGQTKKQFNTSKRKPK